jgi:hypothetical protein
VLALGLALVLLLAGYVASMGLMGRAVVSGGMRYEIWNSAYRPILWAADNSWRVDRCLTSYLSWCGGLPFEWAWRFHLDPPSTQS